MSLSENYYLQNTLVPEAQTRRERETAKEKRRASGLAVKNRISMSVFGSDFEPCV